MSNFEIIGGYISIKEYHEDYLHHWEMCVMLRASGLFGNNYITMDLDHNQEIFRLNYDNSLYNFIPEIDNTTLTVRNLLMNFFKIWQETCHLWDKHDDIICNKYNQFIPYTYWYLNFNTLNELLSLRDHPRLKNHYHYQPEGPGYEESKKDFYDKVSINQ